MSVIATRPPPAALAEASEASRRLAGRASWPRQARAEVCILVLATTACLAPFATKAVHVDDPFYIWAAQRITSHPLDFYGFSVNWYGQEEPASAVNQNPPVVSFYMALVGALLGWSEAALHLAFIVPAVAAVLGTRALARKLGASPVPAALACLSMPAFLVSSTTLMSDVSMLASYVWAVVFWVRGIEDERRQDLFVAGLLIGLSALTKYFGVTLLPLLCVYSFCRTRRPGAWLRFLCLPLAIMAGYELCTKSLYGRGLLFAGMAYAAGFEGQESSAPLGRAIEGLVFAGGCVASLLFAAPVMLSRRKLLFLGGLGAVWGAVLLTLDRLGTLGLWGPEGRQWGPLIHAWVFGLAGALLILLAASEMLERRSADSILLGLWVLGTLAFAAGVNWTTNARAVLPLCPPLAILCCRQAARLPALRWIRGLSSPAALSIALLPGLALSLIVAWGDLRLAESARSAARHIANRYSGTERLWFQGHWGFQYYLEPSGAKPMDMQRSELRTGDIIVLPANNTNVFGVPGEHVSRVEELEFPLSSWASTLSSALGAGFYTSLCGPFPYVLGPPPPEVYRTFYVEKPIRPEDSRRWLEENYRKG